MTTPAWQNWGRTVESHPLEFVRPTTPSEIARIVERSAESAVTVKCVGAGHSFTAAAATDGVLVSLDDLAGVESVVPLYDAEGRAEGATVTVWAGTRLVDLGPLLWDLGLAQENLGDIDVQTVAGAISTGTHGTGLGFGGLATTVVGLQLVTGSGEILECDADHHPEFFEAARLGIGAVGILSKVTLRCVPAFGLRAEERPARLDEPLEDLPGFLRSADHAEFFWFPHTDLVEIKKNTRIPVEEEFAPRSRASRRINDALSNNAFELVCRAVARKPAIAPRVNRVTGKLMGSASYSDRSYRVYASPRSVRFRETESAVPLDDAADVLRELRRAIDAGGVHTPFPIEVRGTAADDLWLSTAHGRESVYISVHQYEGIPDDGFFARVEDVFRAAGGRPHWGKMHSRTAAELAELYPRYADFVAARDASDPRRVFRNAYTEQVLPD